MDIKLCNVDEVENIAIEFFCEGGPLGDISLEEFLWSYTEFNEFLQEHYPDCILSADIIRKWVNYREEHRFPEIKHV